MHGMIESPAAARTVKIAIRGLAKRFRTRTMDVDALGPLDLAIADGEFVCVVGPSGCGKTTLLRILAGLEAPSDGEVELQRRDAARPPTAMIFQEASVFPWMTVRDNVAYGPRMRGADRAATDAAVARFLELTGLARFADAWPHQLSGGMKQRVSVARAFVQDPEVLLMDEPFAALDEPNRILLQAELLRIWFGTHKTVLFITHSIDEALLLADRVLVMSARPGRIKAEITVPFARPRELFALKADPDYARLSRAIWQALRDEVAPP